jgi:hypothetical protein
MSAEKEWTAYGGTERYERDMKVAPTPKKIDSKSEEAAPSESTENKDTSEPKSSYYYFSSDGKKVKNKWDNFDYDAALADEENSDNEENDTEDRRKAIARRQQQQQQRQHQISKPRSIFPSGPWTCATCTFINCSAGAGNKDTCEMCASPRQTSAENSSDKSTDTTSTSTSTKNTSVSASSTSIATATTGTSGSCLSFGESSTFDIATLLREEGNALFKAGDHMGALAKYKEALPHDSLNPALHLNVAAAQLKLELWSAAVDEATVVVELTCGGSSKAFFRRATAHEKMDNFKQAADDYGRAIALEDDKVARKRQQRCLQMEKRKQVLAKRAAKAAKAAATADAEDAPPPLQ